MMICFQLTEPCGRERRKYSNKIEIPGRVVFAITIAPASVSLFTTVASFFGT